MTSNVTPGGNATVIKPDMVTRAILWLGFPILGAGAGWLLTQSAGWAASLAWVPFQGPLELIESLPDPQTTIGAVAVGVVAGLLGAAYADHAYLRVSVDDDVVVVGTGDSARRFSRAAISAVFVDGKDLVLLGRATEEVLRAPSDMDGGEVKRLSDAFMSHGWPWHPGGDPHRHEYRRWVEDTPDLSAAANAILKARQRSLERGDKDDAADLRTELGKIDIIVRDDKNRQHWRATR